MLSFKEHQIYCDDDVLLEYIELDEIKISDVLSVGSKAFTSLKSNPKLVAKVGASVAAAAGLGLGYLYRDEIKQFIEDQWILYKEEIIVTILEILQDIQDEQLAGLVKNAIKIAPIPSILKKFLNRFINSTAAKKSIIRPTNESIRNQIEKAIEKNEKIKAAFIKHKTKLQEIKDELARQKYERMQIQAMVNFGHITKQQADMIVKKGQLRKFTLHKQSKVKGKPHFTPKSKTKDTDEQ